MVVFAGRLKRNTTGCAFFELVPFSWLVVVKGSSGGQPSGVRFPVLGGFEGKPKGSTEAILWGPNPNKKTRHPFGCLVGNPTYNGSRCAGWGGLF